MTTVLGIETSCDETAVAIVCDGRRVLSNVVASQFDLHAKYGGVVPEIASRAHIERLDGMIAAAMEQADVGRDQIDLVSVSNTPGLVGSLLIGVTAAKTLAWAWAKPLVAVSHVEAHATSAAIDLPAPPWPAVALVVSGGHTSLFYIRDYDAIEPLGVTIDDAAGEAFDKVASILDLGYPGGPAVERTAAAGNPCAVDFPRTMLGPDSLDFSFSGIKTAVLYHVHGHGQTSGGLARLSRQDVADIAASFQQAVVDVLARKTLLAFEKTGAQTVVAGGGVTANRALRRRLEQDCREAGVALHLPPMGYCTDNAAMVAVLGYHLFCRGRRCDLSVSAMP
ncbi:MAG TPA: tRNA (adenosine(37)-N6)-threonylcarbamoyltransferase complex transferase subunit TsaD [Phycisphaerae bacterium]|nr:tRNA (adenosine(37)-N6)-threonylcarbamoyltransferase complex transferase subunit TsaD [Phycisphaerae bacterium]